MQVFQIKYKYSKRQTVTGIGNFPSHIAFSFDPGAASLLSRNIFSALRFPVCFPVCIFAERKKIAGPTYF